MAETEADGNEVEHLNGAEDSNFVSPVDSQTSVDLSTLENSMLQQMTAIATDAKETILSFNQHVEMRFTKFYKRLEKIQLQLKEYDRQMPLHSAGGGFPVEPAVNLSCDTHNTESFNVIPNDHDTQLSKAKSTAFHTNEPKSTENYLLTKGDNLIQLKLESYSGTEDLEDFLVYFDTLAEIYGWDNKAKCLYLAISLSGPARSLLTEMTLDQRRDYQSMVQQLSVRFGTANKCELFRAQLKTREQNHDESISELAAAIRKLTRLAYPKITKKVAEMLAVGCFMDALKHPEIRLRLRDINPDTLSEAESLAVNMWTLREADNHVVSFQRKTKQDCDQPHPVIQEQNIADQLDELQRQLETLTLANKARPDRIHGRNVKPHNIKLKLRWRGRRRDCQHPNWHSQ